MLQEAEGKQHHGHPKGLGGLQVFADYDHLAFALFTNITFGYIIAEMALLLAVVIQYVRGRIITAAFWRYIRCSRDVCLDDVVLCKNTCEETSRPC